MKKSLIISVLLFGLANVTFAMEQENSGNNNNNNNNNNARIDQEAAKKAHDARLHKKDTKPEEIPTGAAGKEEETGILQELTKTIAIGPQTDIAKKMSYSRCLRITPSLVDKAKETAKYSVTNLLEKQIPQQTIKYSIDITQPNDQLVTNSGIESTDQDLNNLSDLLTTLNAQGVITVNKDIQCANSVIVLRWNQTINGFYVWNQNTDNLYAIDFGINSFISDFSLKNNTLKITVNGFADVVNLSGLISNICTINLNTMLFSKDPIKPCEKMQENEYATVLSTNGDLRFGTGGCRFQILCKDICKNNKQEFIFTLPNTCQCIQLNKNILTTISKYPKNNSSVFSLKVSKYNVCAPNQEEFLATESSKTIDVENEHSSDKSYSYCSEPVLSNDGNTIAVLVTEPSEKKDIEVKQDVNGQVKPPYGIFIAVYNVQNGKLITVIYVTDLLTNIEPQDKSAAITFLTDSIILVNLWGYIYIFKLDSQHEENSYIHVVMPQDVLNIEQLSDVTDGVFISDYICLLNPNGLFAIHGISDLCNQIDKLIDNEILSLADALFLTQLERMVNIDYSLSIRCEVCNKKTMSEKIRTTTQYPELKKDDVIDKDAAKKLFRLYKKLNFLLSQWICQSYSTNSSCHSETFIPLTLPAELMNQLINRRLDPEIWKAVHDKHVKKYGKLSIDDLDDEPKIEEVTVQKDKSRDQK